MKFSPYVELMIGKRCIQYAFLCKFVRSKLSFRHLKLNLDTFLSDAITRMGIAEELYSFWSRSALQKLSFQSSKFFPFFLNISRTVRPRDKRRACWWSKISRSTTLVLMNFSQNLAVFEKNDFKNWRFLIGRFFCLLFGAIILFKLSRSAWNFYGN